MIRKTTFAAILILFSIAIYGQQTARIEKIKIHSKELTQEREIFVYTPALYDECPFWYYDVIYVFDAQSRELFDYTHSIISFLNKDYKKFIVVGISSPYNKKLDYARNNDMLPKFQSDESKKHYDKYSGNADNFLKYVKNEVVPLIETKYRALTHRTAIGHSLGASFILYSMFKEPKLFDNYIAISPNLAYDDERLVKEFYHFDFDNKKTTQYLYLSNADEGVTYWPEWKPAREKVYSFLKDSLHSDNVKVVIKDFPNETHWSTFPVSLSFALSQYFDNVYGQQKDKFSLEEYEVTIQMKVPNKNDEIYITGNQPNLGMWNPARIKMNKKSDFERELKVKLHFPAQFKFTKGNWDTEAVIKNNDVMENLTINPKNRRKFYFEVIKYINEK